MKPNKIFFCELHKDGVQIELLNTLTLSLNVSNLTFLITSTKEGEKEGTRLLFLLAAWFFYTNRAKCIVIRLNDYYWHMPWVRSAY